MKAQLSIIDQKCEQMVSGGQKKVLTVIVRMLVLLT